MGPFNLLNPDPEVLESEHTTLLNPDRPLRACINCVQAKAKCSPIMNSSGKCERCDRMKKHCQPSPPVRKRRRGERSARNRVNKIEEKLDGLAVLLKSATQLSQNAPAGFHPSSSSALPELGPSDYGAVAGSITATSPSYSDHQQHQLVRLPSIGRGQPDPAFTPATSHSSQSGRTVDSALALQPGVEPTPEQAESYLAHFQHAHLPHVPFLTIASSMTAGQMRQESPLLWLSIMAVASTRSTQQIGLSNELRATFGREAYVKSTRTMDFLLAVLVYTAWDRYHCVDRPIMMSLVQLAIAILYDLGLDKAPSRDPGVTLPYELKGAPRPTRFSRSETLDERRVLLGCFLLSTLPSFIGKGESLRWTAYCDESLRVVEEQKGSVCDLLLVQLVKIRLIAESVMDYSSPGDRTRGPSTVPYGPVYLKSLQAQLRDFKQNIPPELTYNRDLLLEIHNTDFLIHSVGFSPTPNIFPTPSRYRFDCVYACLQSAKTWVDTFLTIAPAEYIGFSELTYVNMMRCFVGLYRLATCAHPEWDRSVLQETIDVPWVMEETQRRFTHAREAAGLDNANNAEGPLEQQDYLSVMAAKLRTMKLWWDFMTVPASGMYTGPGFSEPLDFSMELFDLWNL